MAPVDISLHKKSPQFLVQEQISQHYDKLFIFPDGSKDFESGRIGAAFFIPHLEIAVKRRLTDHLSVFTTELIAIQLVLQWAESNAQNKA